MANLLNNTNRLLPGVCFAGAVLSLYASAALADEIRPSAQPDRMVVVCATQDEAETLQGAVVAGDSNNVTAYLRAGHNACAGGGARFVVVAGVGEANFGALRKL